MSFGPYVVNANEFSDGRIDGVIIAQLDTHRDERGWLVELFRGDELPCDSFPMMGYVSETLPGVTRGPHLHWRQTDHFVVLGSGEVEFCIWDDRRSASTFGNRMRIVAGADVPMRITIPPMVVHAYRNLAEHPVRLMNFPDALYAGTAKESAVDEVRFEEVAGHPFHW